MRPGVGAGMAWSWPGGGPGGDGQLFMLAKVAGVDHSKIHTAFKGDANLKTDFANVKTTHQALIACLASGAYLRHADYSLCRAQQALTVEKYTVWEGVFKGAPNANKATALLGQLEQLHQQRKAIFQQAFGAPG